MNRDLTALQTGRPFPLGASVDAAGVNFALMATHASAVELCLFDDAGREEIGRCFLPAHRDGVWYGYLPGARAGLVYGYRVHGPWEPAQGHRHNPAKLLLDPYAREVLGRYDGNPLCLGHRPDDPQQPDPRDNGACALKARVVEPLPTATPLAPAVEPARRVLYELHLKSYTRLHPGVPDALRGRYAGLAHPAAMEHLLRLGITTVSLMPLALRADEPRLIAQGLSNHWGYNPIAWNAPETRYASSPGQARQECRAMVDALHAAGLEVVLDVVYNHSAESDEWGPTLSLRGIDNALYYHLLPHDPSGYANWSGCGNCLDLSRPEVLRLVMDSLRLWVTEYGIDGFRFDLATTLGRARHDDRRGHHATDFHPHAALFTAIAQDPVLQDRLMIAEPWDIGPGGYRLGAFPRGWIEWNDKFRDTQRRYWLHGHGSRGTLASRLAGSSDIFHGARRPAHSSVNFITAHDGFTLMDLVSYSRRHNHANGENNRDGHSHNHSHNHGIEGPSDDPVIVQRRATHRRALLAVLLLSLGTPMLLAGDEIGHSQRGNNNAYCQDNALTWLDWAQADGDLADYVAGLIALRARWPVLHSRSWWADPHATSAMPPASAADAVRASWFNANGQPMTAADWEREQDRSHDSPAAHALMLLLEGEAPSASRALIALNASHLPMAFTLPPGQWTRRLDSASGSLQTEAWVGTTRLAAGSVALATDGNPENHTHQGGDTA